MSNFSLSSTSGLTTPKYAAYPQTTILLSVVIAPEWLVPHAIYLN